MSNKLFDFCIGNPPYQNDLTGDSNTATPVYHIFMDTAYSLSDKTILITPARFLFNAGYTPKDWNNQMLSDEHLKVISYIADSATVFTGTDITGGVAITYRDTEKTYGPIKIFTGFPTLNKILQKVINADDFKSIEKIVVTSFAYHYTDIMYSENPNLTERASKGHKYDIQSNAFEKYKEVFHEVVPDNDQYIRFLGRVGTQRQWRYIKRKYVNEVINLDKYKIFISMSDGAAGTIGNPVPARIVGTPLLASKGDGATMTFLSIGDFETSLEAQNCRTYILTKFARTLLSVLKVTQHLTPGKWKYVPLQDFTASSDIDWSKSVHEIDLQLYRKYGLSVEEINFIEANVKEMI